MCVRERKREIVSSVLLSPPDHQSGGMAPMCTACVREREEERERERERDCVVSAVIST